MGKHKHGWDGDGEGTGTPFTVPPQVAGLAAAAMKQVNTPAFQKMIADALGAAGQAMDAMAKRAAAEGQAGGPVPCEPAMSPQPPVPPAAPIPPEPPVAPAAPIPPEPPVAPVPQAYRPNFETPSITLPPEAARAIERVAETAAQAIEQATTHASKALDAAAAALDRWAQERRQPPERPTE